MSVPVTKHHDGIVLWDAPGAGDMEHDRAWPADVTLIGPLAEAVRGEEACVLACLLRRARLARHRPSADHRAWHTSKISRPVDPQWPISSVRDQPRA